MSMYKKGDEVGRWVISEDQQFPWQERIQCQCSCAKKTKRLVVVRNLRADLTHGCGCIRAEQTAARMAKKVKYVVQENERYGKLVVQAYTQRDAVPCLCDCGRETITTALRLRKGITQSCGCLRDELIRKQGLLNGPGVSKHPLYNTWKRLRAATTNPASPQWGAYGARGVKLHQPWLESFETFRDEVLAELGERPNYYGLRTLGEQGDYEPGNIRWGERNGWTRPDRQKYPPEVQDEIMRRFAAGERQVRIAEELKLYRSYVNYVIRKYEARARQRVKD